MSTLVINEIFHSLQGESTHAGRPCVFVRLTACDLRCTWCDTQYAFHEGSQREIRDVVEEVLAFGCDLVEVTGGEPLLQKGVHELMTRLADAGLTVMLETGGHRDIAEVDPRVLRIVDVKLPGSGEAHRMLESNFDALRDGDELKFVVQDRVDFDAALDLIRRRTLEDRVPLLFSPVHGKLEGAELARWMLDAGLRARLQLQLHKLLWPAALRGV